MSDHSHDESTYPIIWEVIDSEDNKRLTMLVKATREEAEEQARYLYGVKPHTVRDTGKRKPPAKCCNTCADKPCGS